MGQTIKCCARFDLSGNEICRVSAEAYRKAVDLNPKDYRAWYGLGQTYELLHMPVYALHYYQRATQVHNGAPAWRIAAGKPLTTACNANCAITTSVVMLEGSTSTWKASLAI